MNEHLKELIIKANRKEAMPWEERREVIRYYFASGSTGFIGNDGAYWDISGARISVDDFKRYLRERKPGEE